MLDALVFRHHQREATFGHEPPHQSPMATIGHFNNRALGAAPRIGAHGFDQGTVAMHGFLHLARGQEQIAATGIGDQEPEPVPMAHDAPGNQLEAAG